MYWLLWKCIPIQPPSTASIHPFPDASPSPLCNGSVNKTWRCETFSLHCTEPQQIAGGSLSFTYSYPARVCSGLPHSAEPAEVLTHRPPDRSHRALAPFPSSDASLSTLSEAFEQRFDLIHSCSSMSPTLACSLSAQTVSAALWLYNGGRKKEGKKPSVLSARPF